MGRRSCFLLVAVAVMVLGEVSPLPATPITFTENLGNFPDAIAISAEFGAVAGRNINGTTINATGFLFHLANTSLGTGRIRLS